MRIAVIIARIITGAAFLFSGTVKAIDPLGSAYKFQDYFNAFNIGFLSDLSLPLAVLLCTVEFITGFCILTGIRIKAGINMLMLLMLVFTPLTLVLALTNPVSDCGCFGDAIKLTNWETFWKNVVLMIFALILFLQRKNISEKSSPGRDLAILSGTTLVFILFSFYNLRYLPVIDFLPYREGADIAEQMGIPEGAEPDQYETTFIYEKNGVRKEFGLNDYPADDSTWIFVDQRSILVKKGYEPPIHDFVITSSEGEDLTGEILADEGYIVLMISTKLDEASKKHISRGLDLGRWCMNNGIGFYVLTASGSDEVKEFDNDYTVCSADETTLKTMVRSNPGYLLLQKGVIQEKWSWANLPGNEWFATLDKK
jgi:uncharacterized membrane protein YphA (DoxX/SURF4 family)